MPLRNFKHNKLATSIFLLAAGVFLFFTIRLVFFLLYWADPSHRQQAPEPWMTPRYVAHSWGLDPQEVRNSIGLTERPKSRPTLKYIATQRGVPIEIILRELDALITEKGVGE